MRYIRRLLEVLSFRGHGHNLQLWNPNSSSFMPQKPTTITGIGQLEKSLGTVVRWRLGASLVGGLLVAEAESHELIEWQDVGVRFID